MKAGFHDFIKKRVMALNDNGLTENTPPLQVCKVDGHVHLHPDFDLALVLDSARRNMMRAGVADTKIGFLLLTESAGINRFAALAGPAGSWSVVPCTEPETRVARHADGSLMFIVAGRQVVTSEGLEVLVHGGAEAIPDGLPVRDVLESAQQNGSLAVLPWGVGKWTGTRKGIMRSLAASPPASGNLFLADSGVRLAGTARPGLLTEAEANGWRVLAGSDPLPLSGQTDAVGRFGFIAEFKLDPDRPFQSLARWLRECGQSPRLYGSLQGLAGFVRNQTIMQIRKRLR